MAHGTLFVVATPIGNLEDITFRALRVLKESDVILAEDTRVTGKLLARYEIETRMISYHEHSDHKKVAEILTLLKEGKQVALVTDAGTPGISDPGSRLVAEILNSKSPGRAGEIQIIPIPGVSAVVTALSISGFPTDKFLFLGFPPHKKGRETFFRDVLNAEYTVVFYESNHRIAKAIAQMRETLDPKREVVIARELTKKFETIYRGTIAEIAEMKIPEKGEFVVIVRSKN